LSSVEIFPAVIFVSANSFSVAKFIENVLPSGFYGFYLIFNFKKDKIPFNLKDKPSRFLVKSALVVTNSFLVSVLIKTQSNGIL
jgi:branched-subunit amino acid transport protein AzlD